MGAWGVLKESFSDVIRYTKTSVGEFMWLISLALSVLQGNAPMGIYLCDSTNRTATSTLARSKSTSHTPPCRPGAGRHPCSLPPARAWHRAHVALDTPLSLHVGYSSRFRPRLKITTNGPARETCRDKLSLPVWSREMCFCTCVYFFLYLFICLCMYLQSVWRWQAFIFFSLFR